MRLLDEPKTELRTARLTLRPVRTDDSAAVYALFGNWQVLRTLSSAPWPYRPADAEQFCRERARDTGHDRITFAITHDEALIGVIDAALKPLQRPLPGHTIGYWIGEPYWGLGLMTEAARAFIAHVFPVTGADRVVSGVFKENTSSLRIQEKLGFVRGEEEMLYSRPRKTQLPFINTLLTRAAFEAAS